MFYSTVLLAAAAFTGAVTAQSMNDTGTGPKIDAGSVTYATRQQWCRIQTQNCPRICDGATETGGNVCDPNTLSYSCICSSNGMSPNVSSYEQTLPAYECREYIDQCVTNHPNDRDGIAACRATECGTKLIGDPDDSTSSSSSASSSATASSTSSGSSSDASETASSTSGSESASETSGGAESSASSDSSAATALTLAGNYGTGLLAVGILAAFGLAL